MHERELDRSTSNDHDHRPDRDVSPGRATRSSSLTAPTAPIVSGLIQRKVERDGNGVSTDADSAVAAASSSAGAALPTTLMRQFESSLGTDLSSVRVHTGSESASAARAVGAKAYTLGSDVHFGAGHYDPVSTTGQHLIAHEVAHTVQQRGATPSRQNKLEVSTPQDVAEQEADRAADAMVAGLPATIGGSTGRVSRKVFRDADESLADHMEDEASYEEGKAIQNPPLILGEASSVDSTQQARIQIANVHAASANLNVRKAHHVRERDSAWTAGGKAPHDKIVVETDGFLAANSVCIGSLQKIADLGTGYAMVADNGHRAGYDMRAGMFAGMYAVAIADFARIQGVVKAFLKKEPNVAAPKDGDMGRAIGTGSADGDTVKAHQEVKTRLEQDEPLKLLVGELKNRIDAYEEAKFAREINTQVGQCAGAATALKNVEIKQELNPSYEDSAGQAAAKAKVAKVESDLVAAKAGIDRIGKVVALATAALGSPAVGALGEGSVLTEAVGKGKENPWVKVPMQGAKGAQDATDTLVDVDIGGAIKGEVAKLMTEYEKRIVKATGELNAANEQKAYNVLQLNRGESAHARGEVNEKVDDLVKTLTDMKKQKDAIRDTASKIRAHQAKTGTKGGPDIAAIARAVGECTAFVESAKAAIVHGDEEQKLAKEIADERHVLGGKWSKGKKSFTGIGPNGEPTNTKELYGSSQEAFYDCTTTEPFPTTMKPIEFSIWSDDPMASPEVARNATKKNLENLKEMKQIAEADKIALHNTIFGGPQ